MYIRRVGLLGHPIPTEARSLFLHPQPFFLTLHNCVLFLRVRYQWLKMYAGRHRMHLYEDTYCLFNSDVLQSQHV